MLNFLKTEKKLLERVAACIRNSFVMSFGIEYERSLAVLAVGQLECQ